MSMKRIKPTRILEKFNILLCHKAKTQENVMGNMLPLIMLRSSLENFSILVNEHFTDALKSVFILWN